MVRHHLERLAMRSVALTELRQASADKRPSDAREERDINDGAPRLAQES